MTDHLPEDTVVTPMRSRRKWTVAEKRAILDETLEPGGTICGVARKHNIQPSLLFSWQRQIEGVPHRISRPGQIDPMTEIRDELLRIRELESVESIVRNKLIIELRKGTTGAYNGANAFSALTNAVTKLAQLKHDVFDRLNLIQDLDQAVDGDGDEEDMLIQKEAEALVLELVRDEILGKKTQAQ